MAEEKEGNIFSHSMKSGLYVGGALIAYDILYMQCIVSSNVFMITLGGLLCFVGVVFLLFRFTKMFDHDVLKGEISYSKALSYGFYTFFFASMLYAAYTYIYLKFINQEGLLQVKDFYLGIFAQFEAESAKNGGGMQSAIVAAIPQYKEALDAMVHRPIASTAVDTLWASSFRGFLLCLILSIFFRRKKKTVQ